MEIIEEDERLGRIGRTERITISRRDTIVNDLKNSTIQGMLSLLFSLTSAAVLFFAVYRSFLTGGQAGILAGAAVFAAFLLAVLSIALGIRGFKNKKKIRLYMERRGVMISILLILIIAALYIRGITLFIG